MIQGGWTNCVKRDFLRGIHQPEDVYKLALYGEAADLSAWTEFYTTQGEVSGKGYSAGGRALEGYMCDLEGSVGVLGWEKNVIWPQATIQARGGLIYNASKENRALLVVDFMEEVRSTNGKFLVPMPNVTSATAPFRII